jgi:hypothetical protein
MNRALLLVAGWVGQAVAVWLSTSKRPLGDQEDRGDPRPPRPQGLQDERPADPEASSSPGATAGAR